MGRNVLIPKMAAEWIFQNLPTNVLKNVPNFGPSRRRAVVAAEHAGTHGREYLVKLQ